GKPGELVLLVVPEAGRQLDEELVQLIRTCLRSALSPRHVPDRVIEASALPHTLNGKRLEVPVRRLFLGADPATVVDPSAVDDPAAMAAVAKLAQRWQRETVQVAE